jgi:hypothetical protein
LNSRYGDNTYDTLTQYINTIGIDTKIIEDVLSSCLKKADGCNQVIDIADSKNYTPTIYRIILGMLANNESELNFLKTIDDTELKTYFKIYSDDECDRYIKKS